MFYSGSWYRDNSKYKSILKCKLTELERQHNEIVNTIENQTEIILNREATSAGDDQAFVTENQKKEKELKAQINVLQNAMIKMGFISNKEGEDDGEDVVMNQNENALLTQLPKFLKQLQSQFQFPSIMPSPTQNNDNTNNNNHNNNNMEYQSLSNTSSPNKYHTNLMSDGDIMNGRINALNTLNMKQIDPILSTLPYRVCSSNFNGIEGNVISHLNGIYEDEKVNMRQRKIKRLRTNISQTIYHCDPELPDSLRYQQTDRAPLTLSNDGRTNIEHVWIKNIDEALQSFIDGDIIELGEGEHIISGNHAIYGKLLIRGTASSNWKTLLINTCKSKHFIWIIGKDSRVTFENLLIRSCGAR